MENIRRFQAYKHIVPFRMSLWLYIRIVKDKKKRKQDKEARSLTAEVRSLQNQRDGSKERRHKKKADRESRKDRKKRRKKGRRIKLFISNGEKTFVQMRMRVRKAGWNKIELPISQFPDVISANHSFKLCIYCKRCNKKVKIDLFRRPQTKLKPQEKQQPTIPFIHFENRSQLPHTFHRKRRSYDDTKEVKIRHQHGDLWRTSRQRHLPRKPCCHSEVYTDNIGDLSPNILYPKSINITYCGTKSKFVQTLVSNSSRANSLSQNEYRSNEIDHQTNMRYQCVVSTMDNFSYTYIDKYYNVKHAFIENLIPSSCECRLAE